MPSLPTQSIKCIPNPEYVILCIYHKAQWKRRGFWKLTLSKCDKWWQTASFKTATQLLVAINENKQTTYRKQILPVSSNVPYPLSPTLKLPICQLFFFVTDSWIFLSSQFHRKPSLWCVTFPPTEWKKTAVLFNVKHSGNLICIGVNAQCIRMWPKTGPSSRVVQFQLSLYLSAHLFPLLHTAFFSFSVDLWLEFKDN